MAVRTASWTSPRPVGCRSDSSSPPCATSSAPRLANPWVCPVSRSRSLCWANHHAERRHPHGTGDGSNGPFIAYRLAFEGLTGWPPPSSGGCPRLAAAMPGSRRRVFSSAMESATMRLPALGFSMPACATASAIRCWAGSCWGADQQPPRLPGQRVLHLELQRKERDAGAGGQYPLAGGPPKVSYVEYDTWPRN